LQRGLNNETVTKKYNANIKERLFGIFDDEMSKFYDAASAAYEKNRDPKVFGDLEESIADSLEVYSGC
jgi:hypothetical protein